MITNRDSDSHVVDSQPDDTVKESETCVRRHVKVSHEEFPESFYALFLLEFDFPNSHIRRVIFLENIESLKKTRITIENARSPIRTTCIHNPHEQPLQLIRSTRLLKTFIQKQIEKTTPLHVPHPEASPQSARAPPRPARPTQSHPP